MMETLTGKEMRMREERKREGLCRWPEREATRGGKGSDEESALLPPSAAAAPARGLAPARRGRRGPGLRLNEEGAHALVRALEVRGREPVSCRGGDGPVGEGEERVESVNLVGLGTR